MKTLSSPSKSFNSAGFAIFLLLAASSGAALLPPKISSFDFLNNTLRLHFSATDDVPGNYYLYSSQFVMGPWTKLQNSCQTNNNMLLFSVLRSTDNVTFYKIGYFPRAYGLLPGMEVKPALADIIISGSPPPFVDLTGDMPPVGDQGYQGSCVGWALGYYLKTYMERLNHGWPIRPAEQYQDHIFSPAFVYNQAKVQGDCLQGTYFDDAFAVLTEQGCAPLSVMPYDPDNCTPLPTDIQKASAEPYKISSFRTVNLGDEIEIKTFLAAKRPIVIGIEVYSCFDALNDTNSIYSSKEGDFRGHHAVVIVGYDDTKRMYRLINSWGSEWGKNGFFYIPYDFLSFIASEGGYVTFDATGPVLADLVNRNLTPPSSVAAGETLQALYVIRNLGQSGTPVFSVHWYLSKDAIIDTSDFYLDSNGLMLAGLSRTADLQKQLTLPIGTDPFWTGPGTYYLGMIIDANNTVPEIDEANNTAAASLQVSVPPAPFQLTAVQISHIGAEYSCETGPISLSSIRAGRPVRATITIKVNASNFSAVRIVNFKVDRDCGPPWDVLRQSTSGESSQNAEFTIDFLVPETGIYYISFELEQEIGGDWTSVSSFSYQCKCAFQVLN